MRQEVERRLHVQNIECGRWKGLHFDGRLHGGRERVGETAGVGDGVIGRNGRRGRFFVNVQDAG